MLTALRAGRRWGTTSWSRYCLLVRELGSGILLGFLASGSSPAMVSLVSGLKYCHVTWAVELLHQQDWQGSAVGLFEITNIWHRTAGSLDTMGGGPDTASHRGLQSLEI